MYNPESPIEPAFLNEQHGWTLTMAYDDRAVSGGNASRDGKDISKARDRLAKSLMLSLGLWHGLPTQMAQAPNTAWQEA